MDDQQEIFVYHDGVKVYYGAIPEEVKANLTKVSVSTSVPPEFLYVEDGVIKHNYVKKSQELIDGEMYLRTYLDTTAQKHGYDNIMTAALRAGYPGPYQTEGVKFASWMDICWKMLYDNTCDYSSYDALVATLPVLTLE